MQQVELIINLIKSEDFPPLPRNKVLVENIVNQFCQGLHPREFEEAGCKICGQLTLKSSLLSTYAIQDNLSILSKPFVARKEQHTDHDPIEFLYDPIFAEDCSLICQKCYDSVANGTIPKYALANGLWIGPVPDELKDLTWMEQLCISRVRHNYCVARLAKGGTKLVANAVMFSNPSAEIYKNLPPPIAELDDIIAVIFTGPCEPHSKDFARSPFFVRNYYDLDLDIARSNLKDYPKEGVPVSIEYEVSHTNKIPEATGLDDKEGEDGTEFGHCPFRVHGLTEDRYQNMTHKQMKVEAMEFLKTGGKMLGIEHGDDMESLYNNPQLYPKMFPWLFPYGSGGIGTLNETLSDSEHIRHLLLYHDKHFQVDPEFSLIVFNHTTIKLSTTGSHLI
ncbi:hypothetical protein GYMLUDRAFT_157626, partial [Collybiopsis luxurians FD-317 M1]